METQTALKKMPRGAKVKELLLKNFAFAGLLLVIVLFEILTQGRLLGQKNLLNIFNNFFTIGLSAMAFTFIMALGELDLSVGAIVGFAAMAGAFAAKLSLWLILPAALLAGLPDGLRSRSARLLTDLLAADLNALGETLTYLSARTALTIDYTTAAVAAARGGVQLTEEGMAAVCALLL